MKNFLQDLRYGMRMLWKSPGFTIVAVTALALGIGANTAIFSVVNAVLLRPLSFDQPENIVRVMSIRPKKGLTTTSHSFLDFADIREQSRSFEQVAAFSDATVSLTGGDTAEQINGVETSAEIFDLLRVKPQLGRTFTRADEQQGGAQVIIISHEMWQNRYSSDPGIIGRSVNLDGKARSVIGVMPASFSFPFSDEKPEFWGPYDPKGDMNVQRGAHYLDMIARLKSDVDIRQAEAEVQSITAGLEKLYPEDNADHSAALVSEHEHMVGNIRPILLIILGAVGFVLLIACANVANLLLARAASRGREISLRAALGATRFRIIRQLLTESIILAFLGGTIGLFLASWGMDLISSFVPQNIPGAHETHLDATVLFFTLGATLLTGILFGVAPAFQMSRVELNEGLKEGGRGSSEGRGRHKLRNLLIVSEVALSLVLLVSAGLLIRSFFLLKSVNPGFTADNLLTASVSLPELSYKEEPKMQEFYRELIDQTSQLPGVASAAAIFPLPFSGSNINTTFRVGGVPDPGPGQRPSSAARVITPAYFSTMKIPVIKGRSFTDTDTDKSPKVIIVNQTLASKFFPNQDAIGRRLNLGFNDIDGEIVGIVPDIKYRSLDTDSGPEYYLPLAQAAINSMSIVIRTSNADPASLSVPLRTTVSGIDRNLPVYKVRPMPQLVNEAVARTRFTMTLLAVFAGIALILAVVGIFSVMSFLVAQRTHEFGIRMALGAQSNSILGLVLKQGMKLVLLGLVIGTLCSLAITRVMTSLLFGVGAHDPATMIGVSLVLAVVALIACMAPARRATRVDPMVALRDE